MCYGNWFGFWGAPYYLAGVVGILFYPALLTVVVWVIVTVVNNLTYPRAQKNKEEIR